MIAPKNALKASIKRGKMVAAVESQLVKIPNYMEHKGNSHFIQHACELVEYAARKLPVEERRAIAVEILKRIFNLSADEVAAVDQQIGFMHDNGVIDKVSAVRVAGHCLFGWVQKKFL